MKKRIKTYSFWVSLSGAIVVLIQAIGRAVGFIPNADIINNIVMGIAGILVVFGIVSSPTEEELKQKKESKKTETEESEQIDKEN
ncbi:MAG: phage holin [Clostridia bacterium]|nr:phage holin [Clostridia bacterium]